MSLLLRLILLMDLLGPHGLDPPLPTSQPSTMTVTRSSNAYTLSSGLSGGLPGGASVNISGSGSVGAGGSFSATLGGASVPSPRLQHNTFAESLEWAVADSQGVIRARFESKTAEHGLRLLVLEPIKGPLKAGEAIPLPGGIPPGLMGRELLVFLQDNKSPQAGAHSVRMRWSHDVALNELTLDGNSEVVLMDYSRINQGKEILAAAKLAAAYPSAEPARKLELAVMGTPSGKFVNMRLIVPVDARLEKLAQEWISQKDFDLRLIGLQAIRPFKSPQNIERVKGLLDDTRSRNLATMGKWQMAYYDIRADAVDVLRSWEAAPPHVADSGPVLQYQRLSISIKQIVIIASIVLVWCLLFYLLARFAKSHDMDLGFWRLNFTAISFALAAFAGWIWIRSHLYVDELMFPLGQTQHQIASYNGGIQYVVVREWTLPSITVTGHFDHELVEDQWAIDRMNRSATKESMGFIVTHGLVIGPARIVHPFPLLRTPYWILVIPMTFVLAMAVFRIIRLIIRFKRGHCRRCGYDLRESRGGQCPECGTNSPTRISIPEESLLHHV